MARAGDNFGEWSDTTPNWAGYFIDAHQLMPAGGRINPAGIAATSTGSKYVESGTIVSRSAAEKAADGPFHIAVAGDAEYYLVAYEVRDAAVNADIELVRPYSGVVVKTNFLPDQTNFELVKDELDKRYALVKGA